MKIIDNRYKIDKIIYNDFFVEAYKVEDLWKNNNIKFMKIYDHNIQGELIDYFIKNQIKLSNIKHKNILHSEEFNIVSTIDTKSTNMIMYYSISEYVDYNPLSKKNRTLNVKEKIKILLDTILAIDFLHFRGFTYKFLNPYQIAITEEKTVKLQNIATIIEKSLANEYNEFERRFLSPDFIANNKNEDKAIDYYSLARIIEYLFLQDLNTINQIIQNYNGDKSIEFFKDIIKKLESKSSKVEKINLIKLVDKLIDYFNIDYTYDLIKERDALFLENKIVGREKEISTILKLDKNVSKNYNISNIVMINGEYGIGKTRFLREVSHRLKLKNRNIYSIKIKQKKDNDMIDIGALLRQSMQDTPNDLKEKYRKEFSSILPELRLQSDENKKLDVNKKSEKYRIYNRIANYFKDLSLSKTIYILLDDIQNSNDNFLTLIDYLINNMRTSNIIFICSYDEYAAQKRKNVKLRIDSWIKQLNPLQIKLHKLDLEEIGEIIKNIIGIAYVPLDLSSVLFKQSHGNPKHIEELINYLYNIGQLYMGKNGKWTLKMEDYSDIYIPTNIDATMLQQLNIVQEKYYEIIKVMSVFEDLLHKNILVKMLDIKKQELEEVLEELIRMKLIEEKLVDWGYSYSINNTELKKLIYFEIPESEKITLHKKAAKSIENFDGELFDSLFEELLYHLIKSKQKNKAIDIILSKVKKLENGCGSQARYLLDKAYNIVNRDSNSLIKLKILEKLVKIFMLKGELSEDNHYFKEYISLAEILNSDIHIFNYRRIMAEVYFQRGEIGLCKEQMLEIEKNIGYKNIPKVKLFLLNINAAVNIQEGKIEEARSYLEQAKETSEKLNVFEYMGTIYNRMGIVEVLSGNPNASIEYYEKSYEYFLKDKNIVESVKPINNLGNIYIEHLNNMERAIEYYETGMEITRKYGIKQAQMTFQINISELNIRQHKYNKALEYILEANKMALDLQDINGKIVCQGILGSIYLYIDNFTKAYECYRYIKLIFKESQITDMETSLYYYKFLGDFYLYMGKLDKALQQEKIAKSFAVKFNKREYYKSEFKIILISFFKNNKLNKIAVNRFIKEYKQTNYIEDIREAILILSILNIILGDEVYALRLLDEDKELKKKAENEFINKIRSFSIAFLTSGQESIDKLVSIEKDIKYNYCLGLKTMLNTGIGSKFLKQNKYKEAMKYFIEAMDNVYKCMIKIPDWDFKISFISSRNTDLIKNNIAITLNKYSGKKINILNIDKIKDSDGLKSYFNISNVIDIIGKEEFASIMQMYSYGEVLGIEDIGSLLSMLKDDYKYNLDLILNYLGKETFATKGFILEIDKDIEDYVVVSALNSSTIESVNKNILKISNMTKKGLLMNNDLDSSFKKIYGSCLDEDIRAVICIPINIKNISSKVNGERRKSNNNDENVRGYIYLETDKVFNKFNETTLNVIESILYLIYINLENNKLRLIATTDKLTGTFTRKYYEQVFKELIDNTKATDNGFALLILDLDKFKVINDTYGHRKGDNVLSQLGKTIKSNVRSTDIVARYGGEEFVVLLKDAGENEALMIAEKIRISVEKLRIKGLKTNITVSTGVSIFPNHSKFKEDLVEKADQALYYAKETGRNKVCLWNYKMEDAFDRVDKLAGVLTGSSEEDNKNILGMIDIIELIEEDMELEEKIYRFLARLLNIIDAETATIILLDKKGKEYYTRIKSDEKFIDTPYLNQKVIQRVIDNQKGEFLIDWDNLDNVDPISGIPNWTSIMAIPMIKKGKIKGVVYLSIPLKKREFDFESFNLSKNYAGIFASLL